MIPNVLEGLGCGLVTSRGTKAASGEALLAPFVLIETHVHVHPSE